MINMKKYNEKVATDYSHPSWKLLERCLYELQKRGIEPYFINGCHVPQAYDKQQDITEEGARFYKIETVYRNNGTSENVSVRLKGCISTGNNHFKTITNEKIPKNASEKVINNRIDKVVGGLF